jgi:hypothetical protein
VQGFYDVGSYDNVTYDVGSTLPEIRTASGLKIDMDAVIAALNLLIDNPSINPDFAGVIVEALERNAEVSKYSIVEPSGSVKTWGYRDGRHMAGDVADSARALRREIRHAIAARLPAPWADIKSRIHPSWFSFYNSGHTD